MRQPGQVGQGWALALLGLVTVVVLIVVGLVMVGSSLGAAGSCGGG